MRCLGVGAVGTRLTWTGPHGGVRRSDSVVCPACGKVVAPRKDGRVRAHTDTRTGVARAVEVRVPGRLVTQK